MISALATKIKWLLSYIPFVGRYFAADESKEAKSQRDTKAVKDLHQDRRSWNDAIYSRFRQFGTKLSAGLFKGSLLKLFLTDDSVPEFNPNKIGDYNIQPVEIFDSKKKNLALSNKYFIRKKSHKDETQLPVAVLTHGVKTTGRYMGKPAKKLADMDYGVLVGDLMGFGANKDKRLTELNLLSDVQNTIRKASDLAGAQPLSLISHSMGTALQTNALARIFEEEEKTGEFRVKVKDLVLISPWDKISNLVRDINEKERLGQVVGAVSEGDNVSGYIESHQDQLDGIANAVFGSNWDTLDSLYKILELNKLRPPEYRIQNLNVIHGQKDPFVSPERSKHLINLVLAMHENGDMVLPNARFCLIRDADHFDMHEGREQTYFPVANIAQLLQSPPQGIESGEADFAKANYVAKQAEKLRNGELLTLKSPAERRDSGTRVVQAA